MTNYSNKVTLGEEWGKGRGEVLIVSHNHISHELSSEANHGFEGYSDYERADYGKIKRNLNFMSEYLWNILFVNIWKLTRHSCFDVSTPGAMRDSRIGMDVFSM